MSLSRVFRPRVLVGMALLGMTVQGRLSGQPALEVEAARFAEAWDGGDVQTLGRHMATEGIRLRLQAEEHISIKPRQAQAALQSFLSRYPSGTAEVTRVSSVDGDPGLGFAEIRWRTQAPGVPDPVIFSIFVGYTLKEGEWRVTEIRVFY